MYLTTRSRYGLRAMAVVAQATEEKPVSLSTVAEALSLSNNYLEQLFRLLRKGKLLESTRGVYGGYHLTRPADQISVGDMLRCLEGPLFFADCVQAGDCPKGNSACSTRMVISAISEAVREKVDSMTLQDMLDHEKLV